MFQALSINNRILAPLHATGMPLLPNTTHYNFSFTHYARGPYSFSATTSSLPLLISTSLRSFKPSWLTSQPCACR